MASIITRLFGRYLALFVKQFNGDQLSLSFLGGKVCAASLLPRRTNFSHFSHLHRATGRNAQR
jgi:hypothetical protein